MECKNVKEYTMTWKLEVKVYFSKRTHCAALNFQPRWHQEFKLTLKCFIWYVGRCMWSLSTCNYTKVPKMIHSKQPVWVKTNPFKTCTYYSWQKQNLNKLCVWVPVRCRRVDVISSVGDMLKSSPHFQYSRRRAISVVPNPILPDPTQPDPSPSLTRPDPTRPARLSKFKYEQRELKT